MDVEELSLKAAEAEGLLKAVANKHRLMVLCKLYQGESSVAALQEAVGLSQSSLSQQISPDCVLTTLLKRVDNRKTIYYSLSNKRTSQMIELLHELFCARDRDAGRGNDKGTRQFPASD